jgi:glycosyltransferase involved in cell wall biosynthesis
VTIEHTDLRIVQFVNTLDVSDGGPARNSFELNISMNAEPGVQANLVWIRGSTAESVLSSHNEELPKPGPRRLSLARKTGQRRTIGARAALREVRSADCVIVHGYYLPWIPLVAVVAFASRTPVVLMPHGALTARQQMVSPAKKTAYELLAGWFVRKTLSTFVTGSQSESDEISRRFPKSRTTVAGVGTRMREPVQFLGLHAPLRLVSLSRIAPKKRIDLMIDAVAILKEVGVECRLTVAGVGEAAFTRSLQERVAKLGVKNLVHFSGQLDGDEKHKLLWSSDIFLLPSDDENFGIALAEALAHGLPAISSANVAASEAISTWGGGRILATQDAASLAAQVRDLASTENYAVERRRAFTAAERAYAWQVVAAKWVEVVRSVSVRNSLR